MRLFNSVIFTLTLLVSVVWFMAARANPYDYPITRIIDGDTVEFKVDFLPKEFKPYLSLRILGVDTPEKIPRAQCMEENMKSLNAKLFTEQEISNATKKQIIINSWDKYGGRVLGDVILDGVLLSKKLIDKGYAVPYNGGTKKSWCHF